MLRRLSAEASRVHWQGFLGAAVPGGEKASQLASYPAKKKPGTGAPLHTHEPVTVASFRTWRGWRDCVAWDRCLTLIILTVLGSAEHSAVSNQHSAHHQLAVVISLGQPRASALRGLSASCWAQTAQEMLSADCLFPW